MAFDFTAYPTGPTATSPSSKDVRVIAVKLSASDFTTGGTASVKAVLPKDASIVDMRTWIKTTFSGNGVTALSLQVGVTGTVAKYLGATSTGITAGVVTRPVASVSNIVQAAGDETGDISLLVTGTATTGNPTAGEMYLLIEYVR